MKTKLLTGILFASLLFLSNQVNAQETDSVQVNWSEYYPLHVGDFWIYKTIGYWYGYTNFESKSSIIKDTIMSDGCTYYERDASIWYGKLYYERIDSLGRIWNWDLNRDTCWYAHDLSMGKFVDDSTIYEHIFPIFYFKRGIGIVEYNSGLVHSNSTSFEGAYINGVVYGDTSLTVIGIEDEDVPLTDYALDQNYPNPFNPTTNISFQLPKESFVSLIVYNLLGEKVETLVSEYCKAGKHTVTFNAQNLPSGIYLYRLQTNSMTFTKKMMLVK